MAEGQISVTVTVETVREAPPDDTNRHEPSRDDTERPPWSWILWGQELGLREC